MDDLGSLVSGPAEKVVIYNLFLAFDGSDFDLDSIPGG